MPTPLRAVLVLPLLCAVLFLPSTTPAQTTPPVPAPADGQTAAPGSTPGPSLTLSALVQQVTSLFPVLDGEVIDVSGPTLTLAVPRSSGIRPGLPLEVFREGREIRHPRTGQLLGKAEQAIGRATVTEVFEGYSVATLEGATGNGARQGDRIRTPGGKVRATLLTLTATGVKQNLVEAVTSEVYEGLTRTGKFQVMLGDQLAVWLAQQKIGPEEFLKGKGVPEVSERFKADNLVVIYLQQVQRKPFMDVRVFAGRRPDPAVTAAFFVPASVRPVQAGTFSGADRAQSPTPERKPRSLLARLLGGDLEAGTYSSGESTIPLREVAKFPFLVTSMDVAVSPSDGIPRLLVTDGERVYLYKIVNRVLEAEWTHYARSLGRVISVQLAELTGDQILEAVVNRFDTKIGMSSFIIALKNGKPVTLVDNADGFLYAVDEKGTGVKQTLWMQRYREETFFNKGVADQMIVRNGSLVKERPAIVPDNFRATGATFSNITSKDNRVLVYIDEQNRLRIVSGAEELWRSSSVVGGGGGKIEVQRYIERGGRSFFYSMEPAPLSVDLDGDGVQEIIVPQNQIEGGVLAVIFKGPAGVRLQQVNSGFEGVIVGMGAIPGEEGGPPTLIAGVSRYRNMFKTAGETQIIMTTQE
ncbi:MAG TPA: hypothetical protein VGL09_17770 [Methylomirabilota bacterium]|jgi:hypothetical protein